MKRTLTTLGEGSVVTPQEGIRRAQALVRSYVPEGRKLSDELIEERRQERSRVFSPEAPDVLSRNADIQEGSLTPPPQ
jgi:hypothetical protein